MIAWHSLTVANRHALVKSAPTAPLSCSFTNRPATAASADSNAARRAARNTGHTPATTATPNPNRPAPTTSLRLFFRVISMLPAE
jgi:hypothetical protein